MFHSNAIEIPIVRLLLTPSTSVMYGFILGVTFAAVIALLKTFNPGGFLNTLGSGHDDDFFKTATMALTNPFTKKSILSFADRFVSLQADIIMPAIIPGITSTGRPYLFEKTLLNGNVTITNLTKVPSLDFMLTPNLTLPTLEHPSFGHLSENTTAWSLEIGIVVLLLLVFSGILYLVFSINFSQKLAAKIAAIERVKSMFPSIHAETNADRLDRFRELVRALAAQGWIRDPYSEDMSK